MSYLERIKKHINRNKSAYIAGCVVVAGITYVIMRERHAGMPSVPDGPVKVTVRPLSFFSSNQATNVVTDRRETRKYNL